MGGKRRTRAQKIRTEARREKERRLALRTAQASVPSTTARRGFALFGGTGQDGHLQSPPAARRPAVARSATTARVEVHELRVEAKPKPETYLFFLKLARRLFSQDNYNQALPGSAVEAREITDWPQQFTGSDGLVSTCVKFEPLSYWQDNSIYLLDTNERRLGRVLPRDSLLYKAHNLLGKVKKDFNDKKFDPDFAIMGSIIGGVLSGFIAGAVSTAFFGISSTLGITLGVLAGALVAGSILYFGNKKYRQAKNEAVEDLARQLQDLKQNHQGPTIQ